MGSKVVEDHSKVQQEIDALEKKIKKLTDSLADVKATRTKLENEVNTLSARISELEVAIPKMEMDIKVFSLLHSLYSQCLTIFCLECYSKAKRNQSWIACVRTTTKSFRECY